MQSRCNDTRVTGGYEIIRSLTADEIFAGTWEKRRYCLSKFSLGIIIEKKSPIFLKGKNRCSVMDKKSGMLFSKKKN